MTTSSPSGRFTLRFALAAALLGLALSAHATIYTETEPNDTFAIANNYSSISLGDGVTGAINPVGDIDYFKFQPTFTSGYLNLDTSLTISLYASDHSPIATTTGVSLDLTPLVSGNTYYIELNVPGNNSAVPSYTAMFEPTPVPEPAPFALAALGLFAFLLHRKAKP